MRLTVDQFSSEYGGSNPSSCTRKRDDNMKILSNMEILPTLCKAKKKFGMHINFCEDQSWSETRKAAPYLDLSINHQIFIDGHAWLLFDSEEEMITYYNQTVGDDGPTVSNKYEGKATVYALTCSPTGGLLNENT